MRLSQAAFLAAMAAPVELLARAPPPWEALGGAGPQHGPQARWRGTPAMIEPEHRGHLGVRSLAGVVRAACADGGPDDALPSEHSCSNSCFTRSTSLRILVLSIVAMPILYHGFFRPPEALCVR